MTLRCRSIAFALPLLSVLLIGLVGCDQQAATAPSGLPTVSMKIGSNAFDLEVADTDLTKEHGLMERDSMPSDHGMIFVFDADTTEPFWMHNTRFPLDILFVDQAGKIVSIATMKAYDESSTFSKGPYRYAIELSSGAAATAGVKSGDVLSLPKLPAHTGAAAPTTNQ